MNLTKTTKRIGHLEVDPTLISTVNSFKVWDDKRNQFYGLSDSRSVLFLYNLAHPEAVIPKTTDGTQDLFLQFLPVIQYVQKILGRSEGRSYCSRAMLTNLPAGGEIRKHIDPGWLFHLQKRFHWVLQTNDSCVVVVDGESYHFGVHEVWEINNKHRHASKNYGNSDRMHFIFDLFMIDSCLGRTPEPFTEESFDAKLFNLVLRRKKSTGKFEL